MTPPLSHAFFQGEIVPVEEAKVSVATHALQYGTGAFGGIRGYYQAETNATHIFRLPEHLQRVLDSARMLKIELPYSLEDLQNIIIELTQKNDQKSNTYYRPFAYKSGLDLTPLLVGVSSDFALYMIALEDFYAADTAIHATVSSWTRISDNIIPARGKISGGYVNSSFAKDDALQAGFDEAILLNTQGKVCEGSAANIMMLRNDTLVTPPLTADVLEGITRRSILEIAQEMGIAVEERNIDKSELFIADELFFCGTGAQIKGIGRVDHRPIGDGATGPLTKQLFSTFKDIISGKDESKAHWVTKIPHP